MNAVPFAVSWSGGKDSCLALHRARAGGGRPERLLTMLDESGERSRSHGLPPEVLEAQTRALGLEMRFGCASWATYGREFARLLAACAAVNVGEVVFGDIDLQEHRDWEERMCAAAGLRARLPLWGEPRRTLLEEWWRLGFSAIIVAVRLDALSPALVGRELTPALAREIEAAGADACGENGEFHTLAVDGPAFSARVEVAVEGLQEHEGVAFAQVRLRSGPPA